MITQLAPLAVANYLKAAGLTTVPKDQIYKGFENLFAGDDNEGSIRKLPCVIVNCLEAQESIPLTQNYLAQVMVHVRSNADDVRDQEHLDRSREVFEKLQRSDIAAQLSASLDNFTAFLVYSAGFTQSIQDRSFESVYLMNIQCCAQDMS